ncbi:hypothetical protein LSTR_LSTR002715 [Laodelphax striatellus]|uniref:MADF domain-containing protein n=1 Tax=Laodelphax striatellus TaxID=195883 RepID=A0A482X5T5_LAOST|nr:hypothetical protein LSTR_LSTR002715 [Laodelphax striatellus]
MTSYPCSEADKACIIEFIKKLKTCRCLWDTKCEELSNREVRREAHNSLLEILRRIHPTVTLQGVKNKIENLKACYRRELKKVKASKSTAAGSNNIYKPRLWYYKYMSFLDENDVIEGMATFEDDEEEAVVKKVEIAENTVALQKVHPCNNEKESVNMPVIPSTSGSFSQSLPQQCSEVDKDCIIEFIETLKTCRCLWDTNCKEFVDRYVRREAHNSLLEVLRRIQPLATLEVVKKKIENLKACYRRESKKVKASKRSGAGRSNVYTPCLWYYKYMSFLDENDVIKEGMETFKDDEEVAVVKNVEIAENTVQLQKVHPRGNEKKSENMPVTPTTSMGGGPIKSLLDAKESDWDLIGRSIGRQLSQLDEEQEPFVQKLIGDALFYGKRKKLNDMSTIVVGQPLDANESEWDLIGRSIGRQLSQLDEEQRPFVQKLIGDALFYGKRKELNDMSTTVLINHESDDVNKQ